jgi:hypothetical protein
MSIMSNLLRTEIFGDLWRGATGIAGSGLAVLSTMHEELDGWLRTAGFALGVLVALASFISICQRIWDSYKKSKWEGIIFKSDKDEH